MKKVNLMSNEKIILKVKFSIRIFLIDIIFILAILTGVEQIGRESPISLILFIIMIPLLIKTSFDFYRIFFHRVYVTNLRVIYVKGYYLKRIKTYDRKDITGVYFRSNIFDRAKNMTSFKITLNYEHTFILKNIRNGNVLANLLSEHMIKENKKTMKKMEKSNPYKKVH